MKHNAQAQCIGIKEEEGGHGLNFQFKHRSHAQRLVQFIGDHFIERDKHAKQLISHEEQTNSYHYKYTFNVELAPVCRDDLVILPKALSKLLGGIGPMVLVYKISKFVHIVDIRTMQTFELDEKCYWKHVFKATLSRDRLSEFIVINIENVDNDFNSSRAAIRQKFRQVQVEIARKEDFGVNDKTFIVNTHLGEILNFNDTVLAYDLLKNQLSDLDDYSGVDQYLPDVILVKKTYPKFRKRQKSRFWKLKHLNKEKNDEEDDKVENPFSDNEEEVEEKKKPTKKPKKMNKKMQKKQDKADLKNDKDYEYFLQDLEDDPELRANVNLYKDDDVIAQLEAQIGNLKITDEPIKADGRVVKTATRKTAAGKEKQIESAAERAKNKAILKASIAKKDDEEGSGWESVEEDAPAIQLTELLGNMKIEGESDDDEESKEES